MSMNLGYEELYHRQLQRRRMLLSGTVGLLIGVAGTLIILFVAIGYQPSGFQPPQVAAPGTTAPATQATEQPPPPEEPGIATIGDGVRQVGTDIQPGMYVTVSNDFGCYWARLAGFSGDLEEILANGNVDTGGRGRVQILETDAGVELAGGCQWAAAADAGPAAISGPVGPGVWAVGDELPPGVYTTTAPQDGVGCYWARLAGFTGAFDQLLANGTVESGATSRVEVAASDAGLELTGDCQWSGS